MKLASGVSRAVPHWPWRCPTTIILRRPHYLAVSKANGSASPTVMMPFDDCVWVGVGGALWQQLYLVNSMQGSFEMLAWMPSSASSPSYTVELSGFSLLHVGRTIQQLLHYTSRGNMAHCPVSVSRQITAWSFELARLESAARPMGHQGYGLIRFSRAGTLEHATSRSDAWAY